MVGLPKTCATVQDYENTVQYVKQHPEDAPEFIRRLEELRDNHFKLVLKAEAMDKDPEEQTSDDYEKVDDPAAEKYRLGLNNTQINVWITEVNSVQRV